MDDERRGGQLGKGWLARWRGWTERRSSLRICEEDGEGLWRGVGRGVERSWKRGEELWKGCEGCLGKHTSFKE
eukprot:1492098-Rhodomonas_salina.2